MNLDFGAFLVGGLEQGVVLLDLGVLSLLVLMET